MSQLFRDEVVRRRLSEIGVPLRMSSFWTQVYAAALALMIILGAIGVTTQSYARKARVAGFLVPDKGLIKVVAPREGRIAERRAEEGQYVAKDDILFVIDVGNVSVVGRTADLVAQSLRQRRERIVEELHRLAAVQAADMEKLDVTIASLRDQITAVASELAARRDLLRLARNALDRNKALEASAIYSLAQREKAEQDVVNAQIQIASLERALVTTKGDLAQYEAQGHGLADRLANERSQLERTRAEIDQQLAQIEDQRFVLLRATERGIVTRLTANPGTAVDAITPLATIVPDAAQLDAYLYVPSSAAGFVKEGASVLLRYEAYPFQKFGVQAAAVASISRTSVNPRELPFPVPSDEPLYLVTAKLAKTTVTAFGREEPLQPGAKLQADLVLEERRLWEWAIEPLLAASQTL